jgi:hypothetical protein
MKTGVKSAMKKQKKLICVLDPKEMKRDIKEARFESRKYLRKKLRTVTLNLLQSQ